MVKQCAVERDSRSSECRLQQTHIADSGRTAVARDLILMKRENIVERQKYRLSGKRHYSASRRKTPPYNS